MTLFTASSLFFFHAFDVLRRIFTVSYRTTNLNGRKKLQVPSMTNALSRVKSSEKFSAESEPDGAPHGTEHVSHPCRRGARTTRAPDGVPRPNDGDKSSSVRSPTHIAWHRASCVRATAHVESRAVGRMPGRNPATARLAAASRVRSCWRSDFQGGTGGPRCVGRRE